ncbi:MAG: hypothetical protein GVY05_01205 [Bacteroidetes bacterium]|jgi:ppGpp synthetase/RelA/SpoT-type nucleotidyltranferase|nr:hypothetical protein [Bacteroidota bacterium]
MGELSKSKIRRIGENIKKKLNKNLHIDKEELDVVQNYRVSFREELSYNFKIIQDIAINAGSDSICSYRLKRIESILSKLKREKTMKLTTMGDIAGCRIIVYREIALKHAVEQLKKIFDVKKVKDYYFKESKHDGYKGYHLYVKNRRGSKIFEIQLRTIQAHRWASLVEIIDNIFNKKIKEGQKTKDFNKFLKLLSRKNELTLKEKKQIIDIDIKNSLIKHLSKTFIKNNTLIRKEWMKLFRDNYQFYLFKILEYDDAKIQVEGYKDVKSAENRYYKYYQDQSINSVLVKITKPSFKKISTAYASYTLSGHEYMDDWFLYMSEILNDAKLLKDKKEFEYYQNTLVENLDVQLELIENELDQILVYKNDVYFEEEIEKWYLDVKKKIENIATISYNNVDKESKLAKFFKYFIS